MVNEPTNLSHHPGHLARRLQQVTNQLWATTVSAEVTPPQFVVLSCLLADSDIDQKTLGEHASLDRSTVADMVGRLVRRGLVRRIRDPVDARRNVLRLSPRGIEVQAALATRAEGMNTEVLSPLTPAEQDQIISLLRRLVEGRPPTRPDEDSAQPDPPADAAH